MPGAASSAGTRFMNRRIHRASPDGQRVEIGILSDGQGSWLRGVTVPNE